LATEPTLAEIVSGDVDMFDEEDAEVPTSSVIRANIGQIVLPQQLGIDDAIKVLIAEKEQAGTAFARTFQYRPFDGAHAAQEVMIRVYKSAGLGVSTDQGPFAPPVPPRRHSLTTGLGQHKQVPWGELMFPPLNGRLNFTAVGTEELGPLFRLVVTTHREREKDVEEFFDYIEAELRQNSIYRGKAIDGQDAPDFLDLSGLNESQVVYNEDTATALNANLWAPLKEAELLRSLGVKLRHAVLLEGDYGTGKTLAAFLTAKKAVEEGWTFIYCRPQDNLRQVMSTARLYAPAVVFYEDIDRLADSEDPNKITELLEVFDGIKSKPAEVIAVMTTNHRDRIHKGMLRPGRLDTIVTVGACDHEGAKRLIEAVIQTDLLRDVDLDSAAEQLDGLTPAFVREACDRAVRYGITRVGGKPESLTTEDIRAAAREMQSQRELMLTSEGDKRPETFSTALRKEVGKAVEESLHATTLVDSDNDSLGYIINVHKKDAAILKANGKG
jgi:transitional endoplasmic reticulum ATPase